MSVYIAPAAMGLGDLVVTLPVVQSLIAAGQQTYLIVRMEEHLPLAQRLPGLSGVLLEWQFDSQKLKTTDEYYDLRDHYLQRRYWWGSREFELAYPQHKINDILKIICTDLGLPVDFNKMPKLAFKHQAALSDTTVLVPGSAVSAKHWPAACWMDAAKRLSADGHRLAVVGQPDRCQAVAELIEAGLTHVPTATIADAVDVLSSCKAVVSVDTGMMHLAVNQGTPTVGLYKRTPVYLRPHAHFKAVVATRACAEACHEKERRCAHNSRVCAGPSFAPADWHCQASAGAGCMESISVDAVVQAFRELAAAAPAVVALLPAVPVF